MDNKCSELGVASPRRMGAGTEGGRADANVDGVDVEGVEEGGAEEDGTSDHLPLNLWVRLVRLQPWFVSDNSQGVWKWRVLWSMERYREDSCHDDIGWEHCGSDDVVQQAVIGWPLERD